MHRSRRITVPRFRRGGGGRPAPSRPTGREDADKGDTRQAPYSAPARLPCRPMHLYFERGMWWINSLIDDNGLRAYRTLQAATRAILLRIGGETGTIEVHLQATRLLTMRFSEFPPSVVQLLRKVRRAELAQRRGQRRSLGQTEWRGLSLMILPD